MRLDRTVVLALLLAGAPPVAAQTPAGPVARGQAPAAELVVLVHGMGRTGLSMVPLELSLERAGYRVLNFSYSSYGPAVPEIAAGLRATLAEHLAREPAPRIHFVGHSLGNIVIRWHLAHHEPVGQRGRFVMLAPPNRGSRMADLLSPYLGWLLHPIAELRSSGSTVSRLPAPAGIEFAVIAGEWDGKVSIAETCVPGAAAHAVVPSGHSFMMARPQVQRMVRQFLDTGTFSTSGVRAVRCGRPRPFGISAGTTPGPWTASRPLLAGPTLP
jgi:hypothetical protein